MSSVLKEAVAGFAHVYSFGPTECRFFAGLLERTVLDLEDFKCAKARTLKPKLNCSLPYHRHPEFSCATKIAHSIYDWLMYHLLN